MKIAFVSYAEDVIILGNICILELWPYYAKYTLSVIKAW